MVEVQIQTVLAVVSPVLAKGVEQDMTDNEIIKALELCCVDDDKWEDEICFNCPMNLDGDCTVSLRKYSLDLINRQKAEKETMQAYIDYLRKDNKHQKAEIEMLQKHIQEGIDLAKQIPEMLALAQAEAIKEFAERYKEHIKSFTGKFDEDGFYVSLQAVLSAVDFIKKEMVGDTNESKPIDN